jgi:LysR family transcriptional regulator, glycine cleavage system transcriptional activator
MARPLPSLEAFRFFEAAARHLSFTRAAEELHVTHGAVSQRIKHLEEHLGKPLFRRNGRKMLLTDEGRLLAERVQIAISQIAGGVDAIRAASTDRVLTISAAPCFAAHWVLPRIADFNEQHPDIRVNVRATSALTDFIRDGVDMGLRFGSGNWPGLRSIKLYDEDLVPVCSPAFRGGRLPRAPKDLLSSPLLHNERRPWSLWFEAMAIDYRDDGQGPRFSDEDSLIPAAIAGAGVALARASLVHADLESGRLIRLFSKSVPAKHAYFHRVSTWLGKSSQGPGIP